jgi:L-fucose mutarotase
MLKGRLIHPELLRALGAAGHGAKVLLADGNYPVSTKAPASAARIHLNLAPGLLAVTDVLGVLVDAIPIEAAEVMVPADGPEPPVFDEFRRLLSVNLKALGRHEFYDAACSPDVAVVVSTGEGRIYANILLTIGVVAPGS